MGSVLLFVGCFAIIMSMYGGGFATIPAYLRDLFGTVQVGAIHGRLLTAWSMAGVVGPLLISSLREYQKHHGVALADAYSITMYLLAALLLAGLISNALIRAVDTRYHDRRSETPPAMPGGEPDEEATLASTPDIASPTVSIALALSWLFVGIPLLWGIGETVKKSIALFR